MDEQPPVSYAEYPRISAEPRIRLETITEAWGYFRAAMGPWILATLLMVLLSIALGAPLYILGVLQLFGKREPSMSDIMLMYAFLIPAGILLYVGQAIGFAGMYNLAIKQIQGQQIEVRDIFHFKGLSLFSHIGAGLVISMGVMIGSMACYLPGFLIGGLLLFAQPIIIHQKVGAIAALSQSWNLLKGQIWMAAAFYFLVSLVASLGAFACGIGLLFTYPLYPLAVSLVYRDYMHALYGAPQPNDAGPVQPA